MWRQAINILVSIDAGYAATDAAGNLDPSPPQSTWAIDTQPPITSIDSRPSAITNQTSATFTGQAWAFVVFRFFDMVKPPPIGYFDRRLKGGFGIMFDDLVAAFFTLLVIALWRMSV